MIALAEQDIFYYRIAIVYHHIQAFMSKQKETKHLKAVDRIKEELRGITFKCFSNLTKKDKKKGRGDRTERKGRRDYMLQSQISRITV